MTSLFTNTTNKKTKRRYGLAFISMICCIFVFTFGQFIPVYFIDIYVRQQFYLWILIILFIATTLTIYSFVYKPHRNKFIVRLISFIAGIMTCLLFGLWYLFLSLGIWTEAAIFYIDRTNPNVKIISRYVDLGASGGGTEPDDFEIVVQKPIFNLVNLQTSVDTTSIDKSRWIRYKY